MRSRYDQPDSDDTTADDRPYDDYDGPLCIFCDRSLPDGETDYCDALCAAMAARDNEYD